MYSIVEICDFLSSAECITQRRDLEVLIVKDLLIDSRKILNPETTLFFAIKTNKNDGHNYVSNLHSVGVKMFVVSDWWEEWDSISDAIFIKVANSLEAFHLVVSVHRSKYSFPVVGITGSNGKTIVKEWLNQLLSEKYKIVRSPKSYNSQIGVPLSVWQMNSDYNFGIFEAGISEVSEMEKLQKIIRPNIGIFTNIGVAHDENFISLEQKVGEKLNLFVNSKCLIYCSDYHAITNIILKSGLSHKLNLFTWGKRNEADLKIMSTVSENAQTRIEAEFEKKIISITIPFIDSASIENAIHCWAFMLMDGFSQDQICQGMLRLSKVAMRLEMKSGINQCGIIDDTYTSDINSLRIALEFMSHQKNFQKHTVVLSDMLQTGRNDEDLYSEIAEMLHNKGISSFIGIGNNMIRYTNLFKNNSTFFATTTDFLHKYDFSNFQNELILIKGARTFHFEKISRLLQYKNHQTLMEINMDALIHNLNYYKSQLNHGVKIMAMVKAFSYGSGSSEIAHLLEFHHVDYLGVAYADEGVELRQKGIELPIMVMHPEPESFDKIIKYELEPEISSFKMFGLLEETINTFDLERNVKIHIKIDTGMHRLGFCQEDVPNIIRRLDDFKSLVGVKSIFSHLAASENPIHDDFSKKQIEILSNVHSDIQKHVSYPIMKHVLNSGGIIRFKEAQFDMVRLGIGLYGVPSTNIEKNELQNVCSLKTTISQIKTIKPSDTVGYGRAWKADTETRMAILPIGYADGLNRRYGFGNGKVLIKNAFAPIIGAICMDMCMIDISGLDVSEGDEVLIFGDDFTVTQMANVLDTIPYEILTSISQRVKRVYLKE
jgi:alanine racemase